MEKGTGLTWCTLKVGQNSDSTGDISEVSARNILDDNLWFSLLFRPQYNRFTRVQRLWCVGSLLFLSMVASAMFYDTPDDTTPFVKTAYFEIGYKELYTGFISSAVTVVPSLIMTFIFSKRKLRGEKFQQIMYDCDAVRPFGRLPWWSIFLAYIVCLVCITSGSFFTLLYSLEWGPSLTIQWMSAFFIGTTESALVLAVLIVCLCSEKTGEYDFHFPPISVYPKIKGIYNQGNKQDFVSPCDKPETTDQLRRRYTIRMDRKLNKLLRNFAMGLAYVCVLLVIASQQNIPEVSGQNLQIKNSLRATGEIKSIEDVWMYIETVVLHRLYRSDFYNGEIKTFDDLRSFENNVKMGPLRIRQIRVSDTCTAPALPRTYDMHCLPDYEADTEDKGVYTEGWIPWNTSDLWDGVDTPYRYHYTDPNEAPTYWGLFGTYSTSGYLVDLDILPDDANTLAKDLKNNGWLDQKTRAIFIEICLMNRNNRLFTQVQIVFELPSTGGVFMNTKVVSANLYPYTNTFDFIVLGLQLMFVVTIFIRLVSLIVKVIKTRGHSLATASQVFDILHLGVSIAAMVYFVLRFTSTMSVLNTLRQDTGFYTSFGLVFLWDEYYSINLSMATFIAILSVLKYLSFNFHLFLMYKTILSFRSEVVHFLITLAILMVGFASLIHLIYGHSESGFSSMATSILTLFRMTIGIIKFRHDIQVVVLGIFIIIEVYASIATILFINLFVSSLDHRLSYIKECIRKGLTSFDSYLSSHFWNRLANVFTLCGNTRRDQEHECDTGLQKNQKEEVICGRFLSKILNRFEADSILEKSALELVLLHLKRRCRRKATFNGWQYRYSIDWSKEDNTLIMEFIGGTVSCNIAVDNYSVTEACRRGIVPYGESTQPISMVFKIHQLTGSPRLASRQNAVSMDTKPVSCHVMIKVPSNILSCRPTFLLLRGSNHSDWYQLPANRNPTKEGEVYISAFISRFPHYVLAVTSDLWSGIPTTVQQNSAIEYTLTKSGDVFYLPGMCKKIAVMFPEACVLRDTEITILLERGDDFPILHFLASGDISGPIAVQFRRKRNISTGNDSEFKLMTKEGDLEWKEGTPGARTFQTDLSVQIDYLKESVKTSITVCKSDYVRLLHKKKYLDQQRGLLLCIYNKTIPTQHWRKIGRNLGFSQNWLTELEVRKPRTLEEKACVVLQQWLRENKGRNFFDVRELWM